jgi:long-subunit fatty acid transport protein
MKRTLLLYALVLGVALPATAGGVFYNSNQSAEYFRSFDRNSAIDNADIVYYNMAGTVRLGEGWTFNLSNQSIFQTATVATKGNPVVGDRTYKSDNPVMVVPNIYGAYRKGAWAFFMGLETIGATAVRDWKDGLPTLDLYGKQMAGYGGAKSNLIGMDAAAAALASGKSLAEAQAAGTAAGLSADYFTAQSALKGSSYYMAWRHGAAYRINEHFSVALAGRLVVAEQKIVGRVDSSCTYNQYGHDLRSQSVAIIDTTAKANGYSGEIGLNCYPTDKVVMSLTYETSTSLNFTTHVKDGKDGGGLFVDGQQGHLDLPKTLRLGLGVQVTPDLRASMGLNRYYEGSVNFSMLNNPANHNDYTKDYSDTTEESASLEYRLNKTWLVSVGMNFNQIGQKKASTIDISVPGAHANYDSIGAGFQYTASDQLKLNFGIGHTRFASTYQNADVMGDQALKAAFQAQGVAIDPKKEYDKKYIVVAFGLNYRFSR